MGDRPSFSHKLKTHFLKNHHTEALVAHKICRENKTIEKSSEEYSSNETFWRKDLKRLFERKSTTFRGHSENIGNDITVTFKKLNPTRWSGRFLY